MEDQIMFILNIQTFINQSNLVTQLKTQQSLGIGTLCFQRIFEITPFECMIFFVISE